jgi:hypothetical protein
MEDESCPLDSDRFLLQCLNIGNFEEIGNGYFKIAQLLNQFNLPYLFPI